jgi:hypothetical protein
MRMIKMLEGLKLKKLLTLLISIFSLSPAVEAAPEAVESNKHKYRLYFAITEVDSGPKELRHELPVVGMIYNKLNHEDGSEYYLAALKEPLESKGRKITHITIGARLLGQHVGPKMENLPVNIAYVVDKSLLDQETMDFTKAEFVAVGFATDTSIGPVRSSNK